MQSNRLFLAISLLLFGISDKSVISQHVKSSNSHIGTQCAYSRQETVRISKIDSEDSATEFDTTTANSPEDDVNDSANKSVENCSKGHHFCYTLWRHDPSNDSLIVILSQGCWDSSSEYDCRLQECISDKPVKALNNTQFCCCTGSMCNLNISNGYDPSQDVSLLPALKLIEPAALSSGTIAIVVIIAVFCFIILLSTAIGCRIWTVMMTEDNSSKKNSDSLNLLESQTSQTSSLCDLESLKILEMIGRGRYGSVWKGTLYEPGITVAVKVFSAQHRQYFLNERDIYMLPFMDHQCLPRLYGTQENMTSEGKPEYCLAISYAHFGCLQDYLRSHTVDWTVLCKMVQTITQGLAYLHSEIKKGDKVKPCIAHRDLSSRNIVLKSENGSCMICDFGFATRISGSKYYANGIEQSAETASLNDVGTLKILAPEVLEGAVNLRDCESALKQIDVYALGLILWEVASRCNELYQGVEVPEYKLPFENEVGLNPTFEQMQVLVTRHKARPLFPDIWKDSNPAIRSLKETIEDCWDHDAEARLTALCVEERLMELPDLWNRYKNGTINNGPSLGILSQNSSLQNTNNQKNALSIKNCNQSFYNIISSTSGSSHSDKVTNEYQNNRFERLRNERFESNGTEETIISFTSCDANLKNIQSSLNAHNVQPKLTLPLQPHQGRNPCLQRNLIMNTPDEGNNVLLEHGLKFQHSNINSDSSSPDFYSYDMNANAENNLLVANDVLSRTRNTPQRPTHVPIPYLQNDVGIATVPKQQNLPGNGHSVNARSVNNKNKKLKNKSENAFTEKLVQWSNEIRRLLDRRKANPVDCVEESQPLSSQTNSNSVAPGNCTRAQMSPAISSTSATSTKPISLYSNAPRETQVEIADGVPNTTIACNENATFNDK